MVHKPNDDCVAKFDCVFERLSKMDEFNVARNEKENIIEKAIVEIQFSNQLISQTLAKLEQRFDTFSSSTTDKWFKLLEKSIIILAGIVGALIGQKIL